MIMTEKEAGEKRCPINSITLLVARAVNPDAVQADIANGIAPSSRCAGSRCALWAWFDYANEAGETFADPKAAMHFSRGKREPIVSGMIARPARGYCGLGAKE